MKPKKIVQTWVDLFNNGDAEGLSELYAVDAVNHQVANAPLHGKQQIFEKFKEEFEKFTMVLYCREYF